MVKKMHNEGKMKLVGQAQLMIARKYHLGNVTVPEALELIENMTKEYVAVTTKKSDKFHLLFNCSELAFAFHEDMPFITTTLSNWYKALLQYFARYMSVTDQNLCIRRLEELNRFSVSMGKPMLIQMQLHSDSMQTVLPTTANDEQCLQIQQRLSALTF